MKIYDVKGLCSVLDRSREEILELLEEGEISSRKIAGKWRVSERQLREFLEKESRENIPANFW